MSGPAVPRTSDRLAAMIAEQHRKSRAAVAVLDPAEVARAEANARVAAEIEARATEHRSVAKALPRAARVATGDAAPRVNNPKIWEVDLERFAGRPLMFPKWFGAIAVAIKHRARGDPLVPTLNRLAQRLAHYCRLGRGCGRVTYKLLAAEVGCCTEIVRRAIRAFEAWGVVDTLNTMFMDRGRMVRGPNAYFLQIPEDVAPAPDAPGPDAPGPDAHGPEAPAPDAAPPTPATKAAAAALAMVARASASAARLAPYFPGLCARPTGLNTTGLRLAPPSPA